MKKVQAKQVIFFRFFCALFTLLAVSGCSTSSGGKSSAALPVAEVVSEDGFFVVPGADFARYQGVILPELQLDAVSGAGGVLRALSDDEKFFFREHYLSALIHHFIADGSYATSLDAGREAMTVRAAIERIAPVQLDVTGNAHARALERYQNEVNSLTLKIELVDSLSNVLLARLVMTGSIGISREDGNWMANNPQIATVFDQALATLRIQLNALVLQSP